MGAGDKGVEPCQKAMQSPNPGIGPRESPCFLKSVENKLPNAASSEQSPGFCKWNREPKGDHDQV